jgi:beta-aspartyl-peptidase (threonine type)
MEALIVHGGAGRIKDKEDARNGIQAALKTGHDALKRTGSALEGALAAVRCMEDYPRFNAGTGSALTINGRCQMDASVMTSAGGFGAVGAIEFVKNPIDVAVKVMNETDHLLIAGEWATRLARHWGFARYNPVTRLEKERLAKIRREGSPLLPRARKFMKFGTVGAVARDRFGRIAVATSTGGVRGKLPGRLGDTAIYGAGTFACRDGGASATGLGEEVIRHMLCMTVCRLEARYPAQSAVNRALKVTKWVGVISIDGRGNVGYGHTTPDMSWGYRQGRDERVF